MVYHRQYEAVTSLHNQQSMGLPLEKAADEDSPHFKKIQHSRDHLDLQKYSHSHFPHHVPSEHAESTTNQEHDSQ